MYSVWLPLLCCRSGAQFALLCLSSGPQTYLDQLSQPNLPAYAGLALIMAVLWFSSTALYGIATQWLGDLGVVVGWPVFMSLIVITASILGILTGEWRHSGRAPVFLQLTGMLLLVLAVVAFSRIQSNFAHAHHRGGANASAVSSLNNCVRVDRSNVR